MIEACAIEPYPAPEESQEFQKLTAHLVDGGEPAAVRTVQICSFDICLMGEPAVAGEVAFDRDEPLAMVGPAFKVGDGLEHSTLVFPLPEQSNHSFEEVEVISLPLPFEGEPLRAGESFESSGVTIELADEVTLDFDILVYPNEDERNFRATMKDGLKHPTFPRGEHLVVAMAPEGTEIEPPADLVVPNTLGWGAGSQVLLQAHGAKLLQKHAPYGGFCNQAEGTVSEDGEIILFEEAVNHLGAFLLRKVEP